MSVSARLFFEDGRFHDDELHAGISPANLGVECAIALMAGREFTPSGYTVNYAIEMMRMTGRTGRFYDYIQDTADHAFDENVPTPHGIGEARKFRALAQDYRIAAGVVSDILGARVDVRGLTAYAQRLEQHAGSLTARDGTSTVRNPLRHRFCLPTIKQSGRQIVPGMIEYMPRAGVFSFNSFDASPKQLGRLIAIALMRGESEVTIGGITVTVNFVVQMLRDTGRFGVFTDDVWEPGFDSNVPTALRSKR